MYAHTHTYEYATPSISLSYLSIYLSIYRYIHT